MCMRKRPGILSLNRIFDLVWDSDSEKQGYPAIPYEEKGAFHDELGVSHLQSDRPKSIQQFNLVNCL
jgi:hypothetical protein